MPSEKYMIPVVNTLIRETYGEPAKIMEEVPISTGRTDLLYMYEGEPYVVAVELKIHDWRRGFKQALRNLLIAKYSFLALQWKKHRRVNLEIFAKYGVGVIAVNGAAKIVLEPRESKIFLSDVTKH